MVMTINSRSQSYCLTCKTINIVEYKSQRFGIILHNIQVFTSYSYMNYWIIYEICID